MSSRTAAGWIALLIISMFPSALLLILGPGSERLSTYADITHLLGQATALTGMTMFALTFVLSTRIRFIEDVFGGLDKVYIAHHILGGAALILLLFHPILLVLKFIPENAGLAAAYLLPSSHWSINFGIIALLGLVGLLYLTFYTKIKYQHWKESHKFLGLIFYFALLHTFLVRGDVAQDNIFYGYDAYVAAVALIGTGGFLYSLFIRNQIIKRALYRIESVNMIGGAVHDIVLAPVYKPLHYKSGQFVFIRFYNEVLGREDHPFSIASKSNDAKLRIIIKNLGDYTERLEALRAGDMVSVEGPYGRFNRGPGDSDQIWIAAGIGVTPFLGMAEDLHDNGLKGKVDMYYSARTTRDMMFLNYLKDIEKKSSNFRLITWLSSERGRLTVEDIRDMSGRFEGKEFYLCGPNEFKHSMIEALVKYGVEKKRIFEEEFSFR